MAACAPIVQQATVDYINDPAATNELIVQAVNEYNDFWTYDTDLGAASVQLQLDLGLVGNGPDSTLGNFDEERLGLHIKDDRIAVNQNRFRFLVRSGNCCLGPHDERIPTDWQ